MTDTAALDVKIKESGLKLGKIASDLGITYNTFQKKRNNEAFFNANEIEALCQILNIKKTSERMAIFFKTNVDK